MAEIRLVKKYPNVRDEDVTKIFQEGYLKGFENGRKNAIPVEWIEEWGRRNTWFYGSKDNVITILLREWNCKQRVEQANEMLENWEKENETTGKN